jgi:hypothetical protein
VTDSRQPKPPKTKARLEQLITQWQKDSGQPVGRLNLRIAAMMLAGALARVTDLDGEGVFATKGGIAMVVAQAVGGSSPLAHPSRNAC